MIFAPSNGQHFGATCTDDFSPLSRMILLNATRWRDISTGRPDWLGAFRSCPSRCVVMEDPLPRHIAKRTGRRPARDLASHMRVAPARSVKHDQVRHMNPASSPLTDSTRAVAAPLPWAGDDFLQHAAFESAPVTASYDRHQLPQAFQGWFVGPPPPKSSVPSGLPPSRRGLVAEPRCSPPAIAAAASVRGIMSGRAQVPVVVACGRGSRRRQGPR